MTPLEEAPEQRWRRTVDRRNRPAKLKVDRLLRDFGYDALDPEAAQIIEARLAGVALAVAPSLREAGANEVVTIYADESAEPAAGSPPTQDGPPDPRPPAEPEDIADVAQMIAYLKQQVLDARAEAERLRGELDRRIAAGAEIEDARAIIAEQAAELEAQSRQIAELGAALAHTREALADTRDEIRRAVGELQAPPPPPPAAPIDDEAAYGVDDELAFATAPGTVEPAAGPSLSGEESADGREEAEADLAPPVLPDDEPIVSAELLDPEPPPEPEPLPEPEPEPELRQQEAPEPEPEPELRQQEGPPPAPEPELRQQEEPLPEPESLPEQEAALPEQEAPLPEPEPASTEFDLDEPAVRADAPALRVVPPPAEPPDDDLAEWEPSAVREPVAEAEIPFVDLDERGSVAPAEPAPADFDPPAAADTPAAAPGEEALDDEELAAGFDDFLYDADELYDPRDEPAAPAEGFDGPLADPAWPDQPTTALPPPPPAPPSPWADDLEPETPVVAERATLGKVLRGGRGRGRGRWQGSCSICGREPVENKRKDLEAAGWDLDDAAPACPQCRGIG